MEQKIDKIKENIEIEEQRPNFFKWTFLSARGCFFMLLGLGFAFFDFSYIEVSLVRFIVFLCAYLFISLIRYNSKFVWKPEEKE